MLALIAIIIIIVLVIYYLTGLDFEIGTGFTEMKHKARRGEYIVVDKEKTKGGSDEIKLLK